MKNTQTPARAPALGKCHRPPIQVPASRRAIARDWLSLTSLLLCVAVLIAIAWFSPARPAVAAPRVADALVDSGASIPMYVSESPDHCSLRLNPAFIDTPTRRARHAEVTSQAAARVLSKLHATATDPAERAKYDPMTFVSGPPTVRTDSEGRFILRLGFLVTDKVLARYGRETLERDGRAALLETNTHFAASRLPILFEYANLERYAGKVDESSGDLVDVHLAATASSEYSQGWVPGNYDALLDYRARNAVNVAVLLVAPASSGAYGVTDRGYDNFEFSSFLIAMDPTRTESVTTVAAPTLTHEVGHTLSQRHGVSQDLAPYGLDADPDAVLRYRLSTNFPYGSGAVVQDDSGAGVQSMMTLGWYLAGTVFPRTTPVFVPQFSDPTASVMARTATGTLKAFPLGRVGREDSVKAIRQDAKSFAIASTPMLAAWRVSVVEYYHAGLNQYFMTADSDQIALLDQLGESRTGWKRTGESMNALSRWGNWWKVSYGTYPQEPKAVARFYGSPSGPNTHFYSARIRGYCNGKVNPATGLWEPDLCEEDLLRSVEIANPVSQSVLHYEGRDFRTYWYADLTIPPNELTQFVCTASFPPFPAEKPMRPVWRLFNDEFGTRTRADGSRIDGNHRYTSNPEIVQQMLAQGWKHEGVAWCERTFERK